MFNEEPYVIVIDRDGNLFKIKEKNNAEMFRQNNCTTRHN